MKDLAIIWTDDEAAARVARDEYRKQGRKCMVRNAGHFDGGSVEACTVVAFLSASSRDDIIAAYRSEGYRSQFGEVQFVDIPVGPMGTPENLEALPPALVAAQEGVGAEGSPDQLTELIANMSDEDLRSYVLGITGVKPHHKAGRARMEMMLRQHEAGAKVEQEHAQTEEPGATGENGQGEVADSAANIDLDKFAG